jgi:hypothetical protein
VDIDLSKPLERGRALKLERKSNWVMFKYEKLPMFCFDGGRVIHGGKGCPVPQSSRMHSMTDAKEWGVWLRVDDGRRGNFAGSTRTNDEGRKNSQTEGRSNGGAGQGWKSSNLGHTDSRGDTRRSCSNIIGASSGESLAVGTDCTGGRKTREMGDAAKVGEQLMSGRFSREEVGSGEVGESSRHGGVGGAPSPMMCDIAGRADLGGLWE